MAVQRLRQQARHGCLAYAAHAGKNVAVPGAIQAQGILQSLRDMPLPDHFREALRAVSTCYNLMHCADSVQRRLAGRPNSRWSPQISHRGNSRQPATQWLGQTSDEPWHTEDPGTVASFRTWRGWQVSVARGPKSGRECALRKRRAMLPTFMLASAELGCNVTRGAAQVGLATVC